MKPRKTTKKEVKPGREPGTAPAPPPAGESGQVPPDPGSAEADQPAERERPADDGFPA